MASTMAISEDSSPKQYSIARARDRLPGIVHEVEAGAPVELTRRGKPVAVILSLRQYRGLAHGRDDFWAAYERYRASTDLEHLALGPEVFEALRDRSLGRDPAL